MEYEVGTVLEGKVTSITKFGAFVALEGGKSGLVHISEIANAYVNDVNDYLKVGDAVKVGLQLRFQLGGGGGVDAALDGQ